MSSEVSNTAQDNNPSTEIPLQASEISAYDLVKACEKNVMRVVIHDINAKHDLKLGATYVCQNDPSNGSLKLEIKRSPKDRHDHRRRKRNHDSLSHKGGTKLKDDFLKHKSKKQRLLSTVLSSTSLTSASDGCTLHVYRRHFARISTSKPSNGFIRDKEHLAFKKDKHQDPNDETRSVVTNCEDAQTNPAIRLKITRCGKSDNDRVCSGISSAQYVCNSKSLQGDIQITTERQRHSGHEQSTDDRTEKSNNIAIVTPSADKCDNTFGDDKITTKPPNEFSPRSPTRLYEDDHISNTIAHQYNAVSRRNVSNLDPIEIPLAKAMSSNSLSNSTNALLEEQKPVEPPSTSELSSFLGSCDNLAYPSPSKTGMIASQLTDSVREIYHFQDSPVSGSETLGEMEIASSNTPSHVNISVSYKTVSQESKTVFQEEQSSASKTRNEALKFDGIQPTKTLHQEEDPAENICQQSIETARMDHGIVRDEKNPLGNVPEFGEVKPPSPYEGVKHNTLENDSAVIQSEQTEVGIKVEKDSKSFSVAEQRESGDVIDGEVVRYEEKKENNKAESPPKNHPTFVDFSAIRIKESESNDNCVNNASNDLEMPISSEMTKPSNHESESSKYEASKVTASTPTIEHMSEKKDPTTKDGLNTKLAVSDTESLSDARSTVTALNHMEEILRESIKNIDKASIGAIDETIISTSESVPLDMLAEEIKSSDFIVENASENEMTPLSTVRKRTEVDNIEYTADNTIRPITKISSVMADNEHNCLDSKDKNKHAITDSIQQVEKCEAQSTTSVNSVDSSSFDALNTSFFNDISSESDVVRRGTTPVPCRQVSEEKGSTAMDLTSTTTVVSQRASPDQLQTQTPKTDPDIVHMLRNVIDCAVDAAVRECDSDQIDKNNKTYINLSTSASAPPSTKEVLANDSSDTYADQEFKRNNSPHIDKEYTESEPDWDAISDQPLVIDDGISTAVDLRERKSPGKECLEKTVSEYIIDHSRKPQTHLQPEKTNQITTKAGNLQMTTQSFQTKISSHCNQEMHPSTSAGIYTEQTRSASNVENSPNMEVQIQKEGNRPRPDSTFQGTTEIPNENLQQRWLHRTNQMPMAAAVSTSSKKTFHGNAADNNVEISTNDPSVTKPCKKPGMEIIQLPNGQCVAVPFDEDGNPVIPAAVEVHQFTPDLSLQQVNTRADMKPLDIRTQCSSQSQLEKPSKESKITHLPQRHPMNVINSQPISTTPTTVINHVMLKDQHGNLVVGNNTICQPNILVNPKQNPVSLIGRKDGFVSTSCGTGHQTSIHDLSQMYLKRLETPAGKQYVISDIERLENISKFKSSTQTQQNVATNQIANAAFLPTTNANSGKFVTTHLPVNGVLLQNQGHKGQQNISSTQNTVHIVPDNLRHDTHLIQSFVNPHDQGKVDVDDKDMKLQLLRMQHQQVIDGKLSRRQQNRMMHVSQSQPSGRQLEQQIALEQLHKLQYQDEVDVRPPPREPRIQQYRQQQTIPEQQFKSNVNLLRTETPQQVYYLNQQQQQQKEQQKIQRQQRNQQVYLQLQQHMQPPQLLQRQQQQQKQVFSQQPQQQQRQQDQVSSQQQQPQQQQAVLLFVPQSTVQQNQYQVQNNRQMLHKQNVQLLQQGHHDNRRPRVQRPHISQLPATIVQTAKEVIRPRSTDSSLPRIVNVRSMANEVESLTHMYKQQNTNEQPLISAGRSRRNSGAPQNALSTAKFPTLEMQNQGHAVVSPKRTRMTNAPSINGNHITLANQISGTQLRQTQSAPAGRVIPAVDAVLIPEHMLNENFLENQKRVQNRLEAFNVSAEQVFDQRQNIQSRKSTSQNLRIAPNSIQHVPAQRVSNPQHCIKTSFISSQAQFRYDGQDYTLQVSSDGARKQLPDTSQKDQDTSKPTMTLKRPASDTVSDLSKKAKVFLNPVPSGSGRDIPEQSHTPPTLTVSNDITIAASSDRNTCQSVEEIPAVPQTQEKVLPEDLSKAPAPMDLTCKRI